jgi:hypothetical protein
MSDETKSAEEQLKGAVGTEFKAQFAEAVAQAALAQVGMTGQCVATTATGSCIIGTVVPAPDLLGMEIHTYTPPVEVKARERHFLARRLGRFCLSSDMVRFYPEQAQQILMNCVVVRAEQRFDLDAIEYIAMCAQFAECAPDQRPPEYCARMRRQGEDVFFDRFERCDPTDEKIEKTEADPMVGG